MDEDIKEKYNKTLALLIEQINSRDMKISELKQEKIKDRELEMIRDKEKDKKYKKTVNILIGMLIISFISNILSIIYL